LLSSASNFQEALRFLILTSRWKTAQCHRALQLDILEVSCWLVLSLHAAVAISLGQTKNAVSLRSSGRHTLQRGSPRILVFVPGFSSDRDVIRFRNYALPQLIGDVNNPRVDCVAFNYNARMTKLYRMRLENVCDVRENIGGAFLDHWVAVSKLESFRNYEHILMWGPRMWIRKTTFRVDLLVDILKANALQAIAPAMLRKECPKYEYASSLLNNTVSDEHESQDRYSHGEDTLVNDWPHMFPSPLDGKGNKTVGRRVDFIEWQSALFPISSFECLVDNINKLKLEFWGADSIFPAVCNAKVGVVDLPELTVAKCRMATKGKDYGGEQGLRDIKAARKEARRVDINWTPPVGNTLGQLAWPQ
jgi:hypothetical protein